MIENEKRKKVVATATKYLFLMKRMALTNKL